MDEEHLKILQLIADGVITAEEGAELLSNLEPGSPAGFPTGSPIEVETDSDPGGLALVPDEVEMSPPVVRPSKPFWARYWMYPLGVGVFLGTLSFAYTLLVIIGQIGWGWIFLTLPALFLGLILCVLGWLIRTSAWLHIRVKDAGTNINISLPLPLGWIAWLVKVARPFVPQLQELAVDDLLEMLAETGTEELLNIEVQEESGEYVQLYYG